MSSLPVPLPQDDIMGIQLPDGKWYEVHSETVSIGPLILTSSKSPDVRTDIMVFSADVVDIHEDTVGEQPYRLTCPLSSIVAFRQ